MKRSEKRIQDFDKPYLSILSSMFKFTVFMAPGTLALLVLTGPGGKPDITAFTFFAPLLSMLFLGIGVIAYWLTIQLNKLLIVPILQSFWRINMGYGTSKLEDVIHLILLAPRPWGPDEPAETRKERLKRYDYALESFDYEYDHHFKDAEHASLVVGSFIGSLVAVAVFSTVAILTSGSGSFQLALLSAFIASFGIILSSTLSATLIQIKIDRYWAFGVCSILAFSVVAVGASISFSLLLPYVIQALA